MFRTDFPSRQTAFDDSGYFPQGVVGLGRVEADVPPLLPADEADVRVEGGGEFLGCEVALALNLSDAAAQDIVATALLAGVRLSLAQVVATVLRGKAASAVMLVGILPIYVAVVLMSRSERVSNVDRFQIL